ncbi:MAG: DUF3887 domain-containing protein [Actinobacteria bacterium]|nr:DUF3887 domain-containing protein [Actinomycetota bacterium]
MAKNRITIYLVCVFAAVFVLASVFTGCGKVAEFSDPIAENILVSMNNSDYPGFSKDFDNVMKSELSEESFPDFLSQVSGAFGKYKEGSKNIVGVSVNNDMTTATYKADFENAEEVNVEIVFKKIDGQMKVVGLWFK